VVFLRFLSVIERHREMSDLRFFMWGGRGGSPFTTLTPYVLSLSLTYFLCRVCGADGRFCSSFAFLTYSYSSLSMAVVVNKLVHPTLQLVLSKSHNDQSAIKPQTAPSLAPPPAITAVVKVMFPVTALKTPSPSLATSVVRKAISLAIAQMPLPPAVSRLEAEEVEAKNAIAAAKLVTSLVIAPRPAIVQVVVEVAEATVAGAVAVVVDSAASVVEVARLAIPAVA